MCVLHYIISFWRFCYRLVKGKKLVDHWHWLIEWVREREQGLSVRISYRGDAYARGLTVISQKNETILSGEVRSIPSGRKCRIHISLFRICFHYVWLLVFHMRCIWTVLFFLRNCFNFQRGSLLMWRYHRTLKDFINWICWNLPFE